MQSHWRTGRPSAVDLSETSAHLPLCPADRVSHGLPTPARLPVAALSETCGKYSMLIDVLVGNDSGSQMYCESLTPPPIELPQRSPT